MQAECCILNSHSRVFHNSSPRQTSPYFLGRAWNRIWEIQGPVYMETQRHIKVSQLKYWARQMENHFSSSSEQPCGAQIHFNSGWHQNLECFSGTFSNILYGGEKFLSQEIEVWRNWARHSERCHRCQGRLMGDFNRRIITVGTYLQVDGRGKAVFPALNVLLFHSVPYPTSWGWCLLSWETFF